jgi:GTP pyrophosphokinase
VVSSKAKSKIKDLLKEDKKAAAVEGKAIIQRKLKQLKMNFSSEVVEQLRAFFDVKTPLDLYYQVGKGMIPATAIKKFKDARVHLEKRNQERISDAKSFEKMVSKVRDKEQNLLLIGEDMDVLDYKLAKCCNPIPGDDVFGFITVNEGVKIHRTDCPNAAELLSNYGYRVIQAKWTTTNESDFLTGLKIIGTDRMGLIKDISRVISAELKVNMRSLAMETNDGIFEGNIMLYVSDKSHLDVLIRKLKQVSGVEKVTRYDYGSVSKV